MLRPSSRLALLAVLATGCAPAEFTSTDESTSGIGAGGAGTSGTGGAVTTGGTSAGGATTFGGAGDGGVTTGVGGNPMGGAPVGGMTGECVADGCTPQQQCALGPTGPACVCKPGLSGPNCEYAIKSCAALPAGSPSGVYFIDPDGAAITADDLKPFEASCDMESVGGGWTLVLNYVHKADTNPDVAPRVKFLPTLWGDKLGEDGTADPQAWARSWGHAAPALFSKLAPNELRFYGITSAHERVLHFTTDDAGCMGYFATGVGTCIGVASRHTAVNTGPSAQWHTAFLPKIASGAFTGQGERAMTEIPFYLLRTNHWAIRGEGRRWEVDNTPDRKSVV